MLPFAIKYEKSGETECPHCGNKIEVDTLKMCRVKHLIFPNRNSWPHFHSWYHFDCFFDHINDDIYFTKISGIDSLPWKHQNLLQTRIKQFRDFTEQEFIVYHSVMELSSLNVQRSKSNGEKCQKCLTNFARGEIRVVSRLQVLHFKCHVNVFSRIKGQLEDIPGWDKFGKEARKLIMADYAAIGDSKKPNKKTLKENGLKTAARPLSDDTDKDEIQITSVNGPCSSMNFKKKRPAAKEIDGREEEKKRRKLDEAAKKAQHFERRMLSLNAQVNRLFECRQFLNKLSDSEILELFSKNSQEISGEEQPQESQLIDRLADYIVFGVPTACSNCSNGYIVYNSTRQTYACTGYVTPYTKCLFESKNPVRNAFKPTDCFRHKCSPNICFKSLSERLYFDEEKDDDVAEQKNDKPLMYAAEVFDLNNEVPTTTNEDSNTHFLKKGTLVDGKFEFAKTTHMFKNEVDEALYQATLSLTDVTENKNSYYKIQLLKDDDHERYYLFSSWGRVGTNVGNHKYQSYFKKNEAVEDFKKIFNEKTKNNWESRGDFQKMPGAFGYVETDYSEFAQIAPGTKNKLPKRVKKVVMSIFNFENMNSELMSFKIDVKRMPLGRLSRNQIHSAFSVLGEFMGFIFNEPVDEMKILDCTNKFYTIIPHNFGMKVPEPIDSYEKVDEKINMLHALLDIKLAYDQICEEDTMSVLGVDPVDSNYQRLRCSMTPLDKNSFDYELIKEYMKNTQGSTHDVNCDLIDILEINRESESTKFKKEIGNRRLLWHGSGLRNLTGILGQGLRIAPPEAPATGYMFGKGVYFADMFSKSLFYCRANAQDEAYLLLCDVALGVMDLRMQATDMSKETLPEGTNSVKRYIVYDVDQIQIKYLVRVKVHRAEHL
ncbi:hypothetical protein CRE_17273 [Caenorhabditis remanei]|uniref:Poly [ADP-ribose] polymerase n=1 Tax=Caenorhabditis remanei TaxID=31234 RepID=E3MAH5_CAERE|nr:hypothetical protein CRE_17273 [Caenorhabditis remanei]